jgi:hypothetical protein
MRTLILAEAPFRNLRSRAWIEAIPARFRTTGRALVTAPAGPCPSGFEAAPAVPSPSALRIKRVVLAGSFEDRVQFERALYVARQAVANGAALETHCFSVVLDAARWAAPAGIGVLDTLPEVEVRDHATADALLVWRVSSAIRISAYGESAIAADGSLADRLPDGKLLGLSIVDHADLPAVLSRHAGALRPLVGGAAGWPIVPLPAEAAGSAGDELKGSRRFAEAILPGASWLLPEIADPARRTADLTPARLKGLVERCALVVTNQDTIAAFAIAAGLPVIGIKLGQDTRITTCMAGLANRLAPGSELVVAARYVPPVA